MMFNGKSASIKRNNETYHLSQFTLIDYIRKWYVFVKKMQFP